MTADKFQTKKIACFIFSYEITKGMKSFGPIGLLKSNNNSKELILYQIDSLNKLFKNPDITILSGFGHDKLQKKIPSSVNIVVNNQFEAKNHGYALKLVLSNYNINKYDGFFILSQGTIFKNSQQIHNAPLHKSWIISKPIKKNQHNSKFLGSALNNTGSIDYIFYDIGNYSWCDSVYFANTDIKNIIAKKIDSYYDNMFLFEIINKSISDNLSYGQVVIGQDEAVNIGCMKDKNKIKI